jgi:carboxypeptidase T
MTLTNPLDITGYTNPRLRFRTKYEIESNFDYGQVQISTNNGTTWIALEGQHTQPGVGNFQPPGEPVYDGLRSSWVKENISLTNFISSQIKIRFRLRTDNSTTRDGWYIDDIGVFVYTLPTNIPNGINPVCEYSLQQNYPNPFNPTTNIRFTIADFGLTILKVYDILGEEVATLVNEEIEAGSYNINFDAGGLTSGVYFYKLSAGSFGQAGSFFETKKMILLK